VSGPVVGASKCVMTVPGHGARIGALNPVYGAASGGGNALGPFASYADLARLNGGHEIGRGTGAPSEMAGIALKFIDWWKSTNSILHSPPY